MFRILFFFAGVLCFETVSTQITIENYPRKISCEIGFIPDLPVPKATSSCAGEVHMMQNEELASGGCLGTVILTYTFTDDCGNTATAEQYVTLKDTEEPQLVGIPDDVYLLGNETAPTTPEVRSWDNANKEYPVLFSETSDGQVITRTWTCTDDCGNTATASQKIYLPK